MNNTAIDETDVASQASSRRPTHVAYTVRERGDKKSTWTPIGVAWEHGDQKGLNIQLQAFPVDGWITLRIAQERNE